MPRVRTSVLNDSLQVSFVEKPPFDDEEVNSRQAVWPFTGLPAESRASIVIWADEVAEVIVCGSVVKTKAAIGL